MNHTSKKLACLSLLFILFGVGCSSDPADTLTVKRLSVVDVQVETLALTEVPFQVEVAGTLQAVEQALLSARVSGQVVELPVGVGSTVKKGELLVKISAAEIAAQVLRAETQLSQTRRNLTRETRLQKANASTRETVKSLKEMVQISEAAYREARAMLDYTLVRAPFAGTLTHRLVEVGDLAVAGGPLVRLENAAKLEVVVQIPEALVPNLALEQALHLQIPAINLQVEAEISEIEPTIDPQTRTSQVKLRVPDHPALLSGLFARVSLADKGAKTLLVARSAVRSRGQMEQVFVADQQLAKMRLVRTGARVGDRIEILSGLQVGDQVVVAARSELRDGQPLEIVEAGML